MYQHLSATDQALVSQGQIRFGMTMDAVWLAWGTADQKIPANVHDRPAETWVYLRYETPPSYGGPYYYGPFDWSYIPAESHTSDTFRPREHLVWLAKLVASMICSRHEASVFPSCIDVRSRCGHADSYWMFNARNPDF